MAVSNLTVAATRVEGFNVEANDRIFETESGALQVQTNSASRWRGTLVYQNLVGADRAAVESAYFGAQGFRNQVRIAATDIWNYSRRGSGASSPVVNGAHAVGATTLNVDNATLSTAGLWLAGDMITVGEELFVCLNDYDSDGAGEDAISIWPPVHTALSGAEVIDDATPSGVFYVLSGSGITRVPHTEELNPTITLELLQDVTA